jgi:hypothetical protein
MLEYDLDRNEMVLLAGCSRHSCNCINRNTHDGNEYAECLEFKIQYETRVFSSVLSPYLRREILNRLCNYRVHH